MDDWNVLGIRAFERIENLVMPLQTVFERKVVLILG